MPFAKAIASTALATGALAGATVVLARDAELAANGNERTKTATEVFSARRRPRTPNSPPRYVSTPVIAANEPRRARPPPRTMREPATRRRRWRARFGVAVACERRAACPN